MDLGIAIIGLILSGLGVYFGWLQVKQGREKSALTKQTQINQESVDTEDIKDQEKLQFANMQSGTDVLLFAPYEPRIERITEALVGMSIKLISSLSLLEVVSITEFEKFDLIILDMLGSEIQLNSSETGLNWIIEIRARQGMVPIILLTFPGSSAYNMVTTSLNKDVSYFSNVHIFERWDPELFRSLMQSFLSAKRVSQM